MMGYPCLFFFLLVVFSQHEVTSLRQSPLRCVRRATFSYSSSPHSSFFSSALKATHTDVLSSASLPLAGGLDAETLNALGDVQELNEALDTAVDGSGIVVNGLQSLVASPLVLVVPIAAGILVALGLGFFISSWGSGRDVQIDGDGTR